MLTLLLTCALLIILPILYDRYHRCSPYSYKPPSTPTTSYYSQPPPTSSYTPPTREDLTSNLDGGDDDEVLDFTPTRRAGTGIGEKEMRGYSTGISRKPWDPPFPRAPTSSQPQENKNPWLSYLHPLHSRADPAPKTRAASLPPSGQPIASNSPPSPPSNPPSNRPPMLKMAMFVMTVIIFIFAFVVLIAHCLAWFIVYKTEARLGELHKGVLRGGDMRVCLCAT